MFDSKIKNKNLFIYLKKHFSKLSAQNVNV